MYSLNPQYFSLKPNNHILYTSCAIKHILTLINKLSRKTTKRCVWPDDAL